jgi:hypothetical protein
MKQFLKQRGLLNADGRTPFTGLVAVVLAALNTGSRREFERVLGMYGNGHACLLRSEIMHWSYGRTRMESMELTEFRRAIRQLRAEILKLKGEILAMFPEMQIVSGTGEPS